MVGYIELAGKYRVTNDDLNGGADTLSRDFDMRGLGGTIVGRSLNAVADGFAKRDGVPIR